MTSPPDSPPSVGGVRRPRLAALLLSVGVVVYGLDRATKAWALANLTPGVPEDFVGSLVRLNLLFNPGAAFSFATSATPVFAVIMAIVSGAVLWYARKVGSLLWALALGLVLGGSLGNLTDRLTRPPGFGWGHVVDFLELPNFPVFNIADSGIVTGAALVALAAFLGIAADGTRGRHEGPDRHHD